MGNLIKPSEYAKKLGISRQAVYAKIKKGILTSKSVDGKLYIVEHQGAQSESTLPSAETTNTSLRAHATTQTKNFQELLAAKDETIGVLKETIVDLKETNQMITSTLRSEVELLKEAFSEMKNIYANQLEHFHTEEEPPDAIELEEFDSEELESDVLMETDVVLDVEETIAMAEDERDLAWIELADFFDEHDIRKQSKQDKVAKRLNKLFKKGDSRVDSFNGELILLADADYDDVIKKNKRHLKKHSN
jgi:predicted DNA-binding protein YlxM (UPF0122 family)